MVFDDRPWDRTVEQITIVDCGARAHNFNLNMGTTRSTDKDQNESQ